MLRLSFLPHAVPKLISMAAAPTGAGQRLAVSLKARIVANDVPQSAAAATFANELAGPVDVGGIHAPMIRRMEPKPGAPPSEPNYLAFIEFADPDFPWRHSLDLTSGPRRKPWLVLLVLKTGEFEDLPQPNGPLRAIRVLNPQKSLPDLGQSWAFAHVQANLTDAGASNVTALFASRPDCAISRLLCLRKLEERQSYSAVLVPAYEAGRLAGLGSHDAPAAWDAPAWSAASTSPVELPVYHSWTFVTNALEDVESLVRRLKAFDAAEDPAASAGVTADASDPGYYAGYSRPGATFAIQSVFRAPGRPDPQLTTDPALMTRLQRTLGEVIAEDSVPAANDGPQAGDPLVAMPPYGWRFRPEQDVSATRARGGRWFDRLNLDLGYRQVAALGAQTVAYNQDYFSHVCWEQYAEILEANLAIARLQAAALLAQRLADKHVNRLDEGTVLALAEPLQRHVEVAAGVTIQAAIADAGVPLSYAARTLRRVAAKRPIVRAGRAPQTLAMPPLPGSRPAAPQTARIVSLRGSRAALAELTGASAPLGEPLIDAVTVPVAPVDVKEFKSSLVRTLASLPRQKFGAVITGLDDREMRAAAPVYRSPSIPVPLVETLQLVSPGSFGSAIDQLPDNTITVLEENRAFIEAFLVGANHAMNEELRWREFPTDMRGTLFRRFWNRGLPPDDSRGDDVPPIHEWTNRLGANFTSTDADQAGNLVLVVRGDVVRKLGPIVVVVYETHGQPWRPDMTPVYPPVYFGPIGDDAMYYGFDVPKQSVVADPDRYAFVLHEPTGDIRLGLDIATATVREQRREPQKASFGFPMSTRSEEPRHPPKKGAASYATSPPPAVPATWNDLSWAHVQLTPTGYIDVDATIVRASQGADNWGANKTSASIASTLVQMPLAAVLPAARVL